MRGRRHIRERNQWSPPLTQRRKTRSRTCGPTTSRDTERAGGAAGDACCAGSAWAWTSPSALWRGCQVPGEMTGSSAFQRHHEANSNGTTIFGRKRSGCPHSQLERRGCCPGRRLTDFLGTQPPLLRQPAHRAVTGLPRRNLLGTGQPVRCPSVPCTSPARPHPLSWSARPRP